MGKYKRKYPSSSSDHSSFNFSNSYSTFGNKSSQVFPFSGNSGDSRLSGLSRNFGDKRFKISTASQNSSKDNSQLSRIFTDNSYTVPAKDGSQNLGNNVRKHFIHHSTPKQSSSSSTCFEDQSCSEIIKDHFSQFTQESIAEVLFDNDNENETSQEDDLEYSSFSANRRCEKASDGYNFTKDVKEHFSDLKAEEICGSNTENEESSEDISYDYCGLFVNKNPKTKYSNAGHTDFCSTKLEIKAAQPQSNIFTSHSLDSLQQRASKDLEKFNNTNMDSSATKKPKIMETQTQNNIFALHSLESQRDRDAEYTESSPNFDELLKYISFNSSGKIGKIQTHDFNLDQEASPGVSPMFCNSSDSHYSEKLNVSLRSEGALSTGSKENFNAAQRRLRAGLNRVTRNKSLLYTGPELTSEVTKSEQKKALIRSKIEEVICWFTDGITKKKSLVFKVRNNTSWDNSIFENDVLKLKPLQESRYTDIRYNNRSSRARFNLLVFLLIKNYVLLQTNSFSTQREIFYQIKNFVDSQQQIRSAMNTISSILNIEPWYFPVVSTSKGLVYGDLTVIISEEETIQCNAFGGTLIPQDVTKICELKSRAFFILVVEKDAIFKKLLDEDVPNKLTRPFILVTGKGFPDINTRLFVKKLWMSLRIPVFMLVDADPHGIDIMLTYRFGSLTMAHVSEQLAIPKIRWLGILPSEIKELKITHQKLNDKERNKIAEMLKRPYVREKSWLKQELEVLKENGFKAEIEGIIKSKSYLSDVYLPNKFCGQDYF